MESSLWRPTARPRHLSQTSIQLWHTLAYGALRDSSGVLHVSAETKATVSDCCSLPPFLPRSLWSPPYIPQSKWSQGQQVSPNCMLIRATCASLWLLTIVWHQGSSQCRHDAEIMMTGVLDFNFLTDGTKQHYFLKPFLWHVSFEWLALQTWGLHPPWLQCPSISLHSPDVLKWLSLERR